MTALKTRGVAALVMCLICFSCTTHTLRTVDMTPPEQSLTEIPEYMLLDVGVAVWDPNVPDDYDERVKEIINPDVRHAEANYMAYTQKNMLQSTGNWAQFAFYHDRAMRWTLLCLRKYCTRTANDWNCMPM